MVHVKARPPSVSSRDGVLSYLLVVDFVTLSLRVRVSGPETEAQPQGRGTHSTVFCAKHCRQRNAFGLLMPLELPVTLQVPEASI